MTGDAPSGPTTAEPSAEPPRAPGNRISAGVVVAIVVAAVMLLGIIGLVAAALLGDDDEPTGAGLGPQVDVGAPATAPPGDEPDDDASAATASDAPTTVEATSAGTAPEVSDVSDVSEVSEVSDVSEASASDGSSAASPDVVDDDFSDEPDESLPSITTVPGMLDLDEPESSDLPESGDEPVLLPVQVTTPPPPSTFPAVPFAQVDPGSVAALQGWGEHERSNDRVSFTRDGEMVEVFTLDSVATADDALDTFSDDVRPELEGLTLSEISRLGAPSARFVSVAGYEYVATTARQQGTSTMSGTIVAAVRPDGTAVVLTTSRAGESSDGEIAADAALLGAILAHL